MKSNFVQAVRELTGFGQVEEFNDYESVEYSPELAEDEIPFDDELETPSVHFEEQNAPDFYFDLENKATVITPNMVINGSVDSSDDILVGGTVVGDIKTSANIKVENLVLGNIDALNANVSTGRVKGQIDTKISFNLGAEGVVVGNVNSNDIKISGKLKGNLEAENSIFMTSGSYVEGDVSSDDFSSEVGSRIVGRIFTRHTDSDYDFDAEFDFGGEF